MGEDQGQRGKDSLRDLGLRVSGHGEGEIDTHDLANAKRLKALGRAVAKPVRTAPGDQVPRAKAEPLSV